MATKILLGADITTNAGGFDFGSNADRVQWFNYDQSPYPAFTTIQQDGTATHIGIRVNAGSGNMRVLLYDSNRNLVASGGGAFSSGLNEFALDSQIAVTNGDTYYMAVHADAEWDGVKDTSESDAYYFDYVNDTYSDGSPDPLPSSSGSDNVLSYLALYLDDQSVGGPSITSVTDSDTTADQITENQNATIQLDQDATVASAELQNSAGARTASLSIQSSTSNSVTLLGARGQLRYGDADNKVVLTLGDSSTIEATGITFAAPALTTWANGTSADTTSDNSLTQGMGSVPSDYQIAFTDNGAGDPINPVINSDTTVASVENPGSGVAELYDNTDGTWGPEAEYSLALDTTATPVFRSAVYAARRSAVRSAIH